MSAPQIFDHRYEIERRLGSGGMATVYQARDTRLNRPVAIKVLHPQYAADEQFLRRFIHEAESAARLNHPNIVQIFDVGEDKGQHYIVMEYINGSDLKKIITTEGPLSIERTFRLVEEVARALEVAHQSGMVHRDVKPQNILVDHHDQANLSDFGIAKSDRSSAYTDPGTTFGTADYISPEQAQGLGSTPRSDIYSLGVVTYEMLTGKLPFEGDTPLAVAMKHVQTTPPSLRQWVPSIPPQLEAIVLQALSKDPQQRPASAREFAEMLRAYRSFGSQATTAQPTVPRQQSNPDRTTVMNPNQVRQPPRSVPPPATPRQQPQQAPRQQPQAMPQRDSGGCGVFVLGLLLLVGIGALLFVLFNTDLINNIQQALGSSGTAPTAPVGAEPTATVELIEVPNLVGLEEAAALALLNQQGFRENRNEPRSDASVPRAHVIEQAFNAGTLLPRGSVVSFTLSLGPSIIELPDLSRVSYDVAAEQLRALGLNPQRREEPNREIQSGFVVRQNPAAGLRLEQGTSVELVVSLGDVVEFPALIGLQRTEAERMLASRDDLILDIIDEQGPDQIPDFESIRPNQVVSATANGQPIENGFYVPRGSRIVLGVRQP